MNKINIFKKVPGMFLLIFMLSSCVDVLDEVPTEQLTIDRILNKNSVQGFRSNSYNNLNRTFSGLSSGQLLENYTDDAFRAGTGVTFDWHSGQLSPDQSMFASNLWNNHWEGIRKCNLALVYLPQSTVSEDLISQEDLEKWYDEVKLLRAWYHFMLIKDFGPLPFIDEPFSPDFVDWASLTRPTYQEITDRIVQECDAVISSGKLPFRWQSSNDFDKVNMAVAYALKSRVLLYNASLLNNPNSDTQKWQQAASAAQECLNAIGSDYGLLPISDYGLLFNEAVDVLNREVILRSTINDATVMNANNGVDLSGLGSSTQSANCGAVPTQELVDCFELLNGDLPVSSYNNSSHTDVSFNAGYSESVGDDPYSNRDARLQYAIVFNGAKYGKYKGMPANADELTIFTYEGKAKTGFNNSPTSQEEADQRRSSTGYYSRKFRSANYWGSTTGGANAYKIYFRVAEVYLNLAEAQCEAGNLDAAIAALDVIRTRAGQPGIASVPGYSKTKEFLIERIRNERRVELCFEGHRFYDQRRWRILNETNTAISGMKVTSSDGTDEGTFSYERVQIDVPRNAASDKYLVLPIYTEEARRLEGIGQPDVWN